MARGRGRRMQAPPKVGGGFRNRLVNVHKGKPPFRNRLLPVPGAQGFDVGASLPPVAGGTVTCLQEGGAGTPDIYTVTVTDSLSPFTLSPRSSFFAGFDGDFFGTTSNIDGATATAADVLSALLAANGLPDAVTGFSDPPLITVTGPDGGPYEITFNTASNNGWGLHIDELIATNAVAVQDSLGVGGYELQHYVITALSGDLVWTFTGADGTDVVVTLPFDATDADIKAAVNAETEGTNIKVGTESGSFDPQTIFFNYNDTVVGDLPVALTTIMEA